MIVVLCKIEKGLGLIKIKSIILTVSTVSLRISSVSGGTRALGVVHGGGTDRVHSAPRDQTRVDAAAGVAHLGRPAVRVHLALRRASD